jgi:hypothetical protein
MMAQRIANNIDFLNLLCKACKSKARRRELITFANRDEIDAICECVENFLNGNVNDKGLKKKMSKHKRLLRLLRDKKKSVKKKKDAIIQHGGFLPGLLIPLLSIASGIIGSAI